jgi:hypothetical protein
MAKTMMAMISLGEKEVLGRTNRLLSFATTRNKTMHPKFAFLSEGACLPSRCLAEDGGFRSFGET